MDQFKILFVCMGNICRSPAAECVMRSIVEREGLEDRIICDSAGTISFHTGEPPDKRMRQTGSSRGVRIDGSARQIKAQDLDEFDLVLAMDDENLANIHSLDNGSRAEKILPFCGFLKRHQNSEVPDPYYGGQTGFELVLDLLQDGCEEVLQHVINQLD